MMWRSIISSRLMRALTCFIVLTAMTVPAWANPGSPLSQDAPTLGELAEMESFPEQRYEEGLTNNPTMMQSAALETEYTLSTGDVLNIKDETMGDLAIGVKILNDGSINLPLVGKVEISGKSQVDAQQQINDVYKKYFINPAIILEIASPRPVRVYVTGAVASPGVYISGKNLQPDSLGNTTLGDANMMAMNYRIYVSDAIILAGGLKYNANVHDVVIRRSFPKPQIIHINLMDLFTNANTIQDLPLNDKDVVVINELPREQIVMNEEWQSLSRSNLSRGSFKVNVLGAVTKPGMYEVQANDTALSAIASAGGFNDMASQDSVYILRTNSAGQVFKRQLQLKDKTLLASNNLEEFAMLLPNDIVFVDESGGKKGMKFAHELFNRSSSAAVFTLINQMFGN